MITDKVKAMNWKYVEKIKNYGSIQEFEEKFSYSFPDDYVGFVEMFNGGTPECDTFDTETSTEHVFKVLLSFNKDDVENIWDVQEWNKEELEDKYIAIALDVFGNLICFEKSNNSIVYINIENLQKETVSDTFSGFINLLY